MRNGFTISSLTASISFFVCFGFPSTAGRRQQAQHPDLRHPRPEGEQTPDANVDDVGLLDVIAERAELCRVPAAGVPAAGPERRNATADRIVRLHCR